MTFLNRMIRGATLVVLSAMLFASTGWAQPVEPAENPEEAAEEAAAQPAEVASIMDWLNANEEYSQLAAALTKTGLDQVLAAEGSFTLFAPTNEAFAALPEGTLDSMDAQQLTNLLRNHIVAQKLTSEDLAAAETIEAVSGTMLPVSGDQVGGASIAEADIEASNGMIFVIEQVITGDQDPGRL